MVGSYRARRYIVGPHDRSVESLVGPGSLRSRLFTQLHRFSQSRLVRTPLLWATVAAGLLFLGAGTGVLVFTIDASLDVAELIIRSAEIRMNVASA